MHTKKKSFSRSTYFPPPKDSVARQKAYLEWLQKNSPSMYAHAVAPGRVVRLNGMGDFWSDMRDKLIGGAKVEAGKVADKAAATVTGAIAAKEAAKRAKTRVEVEKQWNLVNMDRIKQGLAPIPREGFQPDLTTEHRFSVDPKILIIGALSVAAAFWALRGRGKK